MTAKADAFSEAKELNRLDDPSVRNRCVKLKWRSNLQNRLAAAAGLLLLPAFFLLDQGYVGNVSRYTHRRSPPAPALIPYGYACLGISLALFVSLLGFRNYCLFDTLEHRLYRHFRFLWWRRREIVFRAGEILALTTDGQPRTRKYGVRWYYRMVAVGRDGRKQPLSNWRQGGLDRWNAKARLLAPQFGCEFREAPSGCAVSVEDDGGTPKLAFSPPDQPTGKALAWRVGGVAAFALLWFLVRFVILPRH